MKKNNNNKVMKNAPTPYTIKVCRNFNKAEMQHAAWTTVAAESVLRVRTLLHLVQFEMQVQVEPGSKEPLDWRTHQEHVGVQVGTAQTMAHQQGSAVQSWFR